MPYWATGVGSHTTLSFSSEQQVITLQGKSLNHINGHLKGKKWPNIDNCPWYNLIIFNLLVFPTGQYICLKHGQSLLIPLVPSPWPRS